MRPENGKQFFTGLESLRGIAALMVVFFHLSPWYQPFFDVVFVRNGFLMVDFFFVLSGFVMALNYGQRVRGFRDLKEFALLRAVRLYPVHLVFLLLFLGVEFLKYVAVQKGYGAGSAPPFQANNLTAFIEQIFLVQALGFTPGAASTFNGPAWSISTEFYTYLVFGSALLMFGARRLNFLSVLIATIAGVTYLKLGHDFMDFEYILRCLCGFFVGCLVFTIYQRGSKWPLAVTYLALLAIGFFLVFANFQRPALVMIPLSALLILSVIKSRNGGPHWLNWAPLRGLGMISYSLYMSHALVLWFVNQILRFVFHFPVRTLESGSFPEVPWGAAMVIYPLTILACLVVGALTYKLVEVPSLRWTKNLKRSFVKPANFDKASQA